MAKILNNIPRGGLVISSGKGNVGSKTSKPPGWQKAGDVLSAKVK